MARAAAEEHGGVLSRDRLRSLGVGPQQISREVAAERWVLQGARTVALHTGASSDTALRWRAVWEVGRGAVLDGVSALQAGGLQNFTSQDVHVSVFHPVSVERPVGGVQIHRVRDGLVSDTCGSLPRTRPPVAAVRAAQWAVSPRQAALILCLVVQQGLVRPHDLVPVRWPGAHYGRTAFVRQVIADVTDGAHSLGELDFAALCRERGLPVPDRQAVRRTRAGRVYLDVRWSWLHLVVEIDGAQHRQGLAVTDDNVRRNDVVLGDDRVLTIDLVGLRLLADTFMDQVQAAIHIQQRRFAA